MSRLHWWGLGGFSLCVLLGVFWFLRISHSSDHEIDCEDTVSLSDCAAKTSRVSESLSVSSRPLKKPLLASSSSSSTIPLVAELPSIILQKYAVLYSNLSLNENQKNAMTQLLLQREGLLSAPFYDGRSNEAEVESNLKKRDQQIAELDEKIHQLLSGDDVKKYELLKDSTYEQAQLNSVYELMGDASAIAADTKNRLLLSKMEQKQLAMVQIQASLNNIANAAVGSRAFLIKQLREKLIEQQKEFFLAAKPMLLNDQFDLLKDYEQQAFDERWTEISAGFPAE